jgi:hypothetical protein
MISFINKWLRRRDVSARPPEQSFTFCGVSLSRTSATNEQANNEMLQQILQEMAKHTFIEIRY